MYSSHHKPSCSGSPEDVRCRCREDPNNYDFDIGCARIPTPLGSDSTIPDWLAKLRRHLYVFKDREAWEDVLKRQIDSHELSHAELQLDMPVRMRC